MNCLHCKKKAKNRGLCGCHYKAMQRLVKAGIYDWPKLERTSLCLPIRKKPRGKNMGIYRALLLGKPFEVSATGNKRIMLLSLAKAQGIKVRTRKAGRKFKVTFL